MGSKYVSVLVSALLTDNKLVYLFGHLVNTLVKYTQIRLYIMKKHYNI